MKTARINRALKLMLALSELRKQKAAVMSLRPYLPTAVPFNEVVTHLDSEAAETVRRLQTIKP